MKKSIAFLIAIIMILSATAAFAEGNPPAGGPGGTPPGGEMGTPPDGTPPDGFGGGNPPDGMGGGFGGGTPPGERTSFFEYTAATEISDAASVSGEACISETADESALIVNTAGDVTLENITVTKAGDSSGGDNCNFYGLNAALLVMGGHNHHS